MTGIIGGADRVSRWARCTAGPSAGGAATGSRCSETRLFGRVPPKIRKVQGCGQHLCRTFWTLKVIPVCLAAVWPTRRMNE